MYSNAYEQVIREVVGDMVQPFLPTVHMTVWYGSERVINGCEFKASDVDTAPMVFIGGESNELYTLIMIDPDASNPIEPCLKHVSWIVTNIPGGTSHAEGTEVVSYEVSNHEVGIHRNIFGLYKQQNQLAIGNIEAPASRVCFNIRAFATENNLGNPVRITYFNMRRQTNKRKNRA